RNDRSQSRSVFRHRLLGALNEVRTATFGRQLGRLGDRRFLLGVIEGGDGLVGVVQDRPDDAHAGGGLGRPAGLGLRFGSRLGLLLGLTIRRVYLFDLLDQ